MRKLHIAAALAAATLAATAPANAQTSDKPAAPKAAHRKPRAAAKPASLPPAAIVPPRDGAADASLERRRRAFFAKPDENGDAGTGPTPPGGVTLGGSGGVTPGMNFKF